MMNLQGESMNYLDWNKIIRWFTFEWQKKLIALLLAVIFWFYVNNWFYAEQDISLPIQYRNLPQGLILVDNPDTTAPLIVKGQRGKMDEHNLARMIKLVVNLDQAAVGSAFYKIEIVINDGQSDLIINLQKDKVRLKIDKLVSRIVPVHIMLDGTPPDGFIIEEIKLSQKMINISGPAELIPLISQIDTRPLPVSTITNEINGPVALDLPKYISTPGQDKIDVFIKVAKKETKTETVKP
jgi:YbbR domain-containing protein